MATSDDAPADATRHLLQETLQGNRAALDQILRQHLPELRVFVRLQVGELLRQQESSSDVVQSVCRELLEGLDRFEYRGEEQFRNWLYVAALNKIRQHDRYFRAAKRDPARELRLDTDARDVALEGAYATAFTPSRQAMAREDIERLEAGFDSLPEHYRQVITLSRIVGLSQEQIAEEMGRSVPSVRNLLNRALARLAALADEPQG
jgi:RNA polymerase sigma-70 factor (subfamily 1)